MGVAISGAAALTAPPHLPRHPRRSRQLCRRIGRAAGRAVPVQQAWQAPGVGLFTVEEAREELLGLRPVLDELVAVRADATELAAALRLGAASGLGGRAELKAAEARLDDMMTRVQATGAELKGFAPLLVDFPADLYGVAVLLCWVEGESALEWYHRVDLGFAGRRRLPRAAGGRLDP